jgi:hypothetical protein
VALPATCHHIGVRKKMASEVNEALKVYLGTDATGGFNPIGCVERLVHAYPTDHLQKQKLIECYLNEWHAPDWSKHDLIQAGDVFEDILRMKFPELDAVIIRALGNRFTFNNR